MRDQAQAVLEDNLCQENQAGIVYLGMTDSAARDNRCVNNVRFGMAVAEQAQPTLEENVCEGNKQNGLIYFGSAGGVARQNRCVGNGMYGIAIQDQAQPFLVVNDCTGNQGGAIGYFGLTRFSQLMESKLLASAGVEEAVVAILTDCSPQADLFIRAAIPPHELANARLTCQVPAGETVWGLIDCTIFGSAKDAMLFGTRGIFYRHCGVKPRTGELAYALFPNYHFQIDETHDIRLTPKLRFSLSGSNVAALKAVQILMAIRQFVIAKDIVPLSNIWTKQFSMINFFLKKQYFNF